jgi:hypothetical protein
MEVKVKKDKIIDCPQCGTPLDIDDEESSNTVWWDTGEIVVMIPREMLKYLEDSHGELAFA